VPTAFLRSTWRPAILAAVAALAVYAITLAGTYVYDDRYILLGDPRISDASRWHEYWTKDYFLGGADNLYRPLVSMSYALQAKLHGTGERAAWAFHLVNWLLHAGVSAALAELTRRMTRSMTIATIAGLLFAVHPIHVEAVANIVGRAELMCALGVLGALILFFGPLTTRRVIAIVGCMIFAILSKEQGLLLPLMLIAAIPLRRQAQVDSSAALRPLAENPDDARSADEPLAYAHHGTRNARRFSGPPLLLVLLTSWTLAAYIVFRESILKFWWDRSFLDRTINPMIRSVGIDRALMPFALLGRYITMLIAPLRPNPDYGGETIGSRISLTDPYLYIGAVTVIALIVACAIALRRRAWIVVFCIVCFALIYGMIGNILTLIGTNFGERLMYLPSALLCIAAAVLLARLPSRRVMMTTVAAVVVLFSLRTIVYAARWNDPPRLFSVAIEQHPRAIRLYLLLSEEYQRRGDLDRAADALARGREIEPGYYRVWLNSARLAIAMQEPERALAFAREAQHLTPTLEGQKLMGDAFRAMAATTRPASSEEDFFR
jgi:protein O-mannosyl-transferase